MGKSSDTARRSSVSADADGLSHKPHAVGGAENVNVDGDQSRFAAVLGILRKFIGVADIINLRVSLPSQLLDPIPNLEYWNYMDSPKHFVAMSEPDDDVDRMLAVLAWWFSKLHKHKGRVHKPFNSILGEQFFCHWEVDGDSAGAAGGSGGARDGTSASSVTAVADGGKVRVEYITEQVSHHPPVSAFVYRCKERGIEAAGMDHITAKFTGLSATVATGKECHGIFVTLGQRDGEMYKCTHPVGSIVGWLRGTLRVQLIESSYMVCAQTGLAAVIEFKEERWFGKSKGNVSGAVFRYDAQAHGDAIAGWRLKDIPRECTVVATLGGSWDQKVTVQRPGAEERELIDMGALQAADRVVKPLAEQGEHESRRVWEPVAAQMRQGRYGDATRLKREIEDRQRDLAAARTQQGEPFVPALFKPGYAATGRPELLDDAPLNL